MNIEVNSVEFDIFKMKKWHFLFLSYLNNMADSILILYNLF